MGAILAYVERILGIAVNLLGLVEAIRAAVAHVVQEHTPYRIEDDVTNIRNGLRNPGTGAVDTRALLSSLTTNGTYDLADILTAIGAIPNPVNLPVVPPSGYGPDDPQDVWDNASVLADDAYNQGYTYTPADLLSYVGTQVFLGMEAQGVPDPRNPDFLVVGGNTPRGVRSTIGWIGFAGVARVPAIDWTTWNGTDSLAAFLNTAQATYTFSTTGPDGATIPGYAWARASLPNNTWYLCRWAEWWLPYLSGRAAFDDTAILAAISASETVITNAITASEGVITTAITNAVTAINAHTDGAVTAINAHSDANATAIESHVDASLATLQTNLLAVFNNVALKRHVPGQYTGGFTTSFGAPQVITTPTVITAHCTGVEVLVSNPPTGGSKWTVGTYTYHRYIGSVAFIDPGNRAEPFQYLGWDTAIYTPKSMNFAEKVAITPANGVTLTVRTFVGN